MTSDLLPSWRAGRARDEIAAFLEASDQIPPEDRLACFDNDGTLWCERPRYIQLEFLLHHLRQRVSADPALAETPEFAAVLSGDGSAVQQVGLPRIALALTDLFTGLSADRFRALVREFMSSAENPVLGRPHRACVYLPMLELIDELRRRDFSIAVVTGGGTEFVRAVGRELYGVAPESVVGTLLEYDLADGGDGPVLTRSDRVSGTINDGPDKVSHIQAQLGRRPVFAAGNTTGDREMLTWAETADVPSMALLVDHDDATREFSYPGTGESASPEEPIDEVARRRGWTLVSMARDWDEVFPSPLP